VNCPFKKYTVSTKSDSIEKSAHLLDTIASFDHR
jgi:hypothetical protein